MRPLLVLLPLLFAACTTSPPEPAGFRAGFGRADITPAIPEPWTDANGDGRFSAEDGDSFDDRDGDGVFDALWLAGSFEGRAAAAVADSLTATALVVDDGERRIAMVSIDNFGMMLDDVEDVRSRIPAEWGVGRTLVIATGTHSAPDLVGWWTPETAAPDARLAYLEQAKEGIVQAIGAAVEALEPASMQLAELDDSAVSPVVDLRPPYVYDPGVRLIRFVDPEGDAIGTVVNWTCTPELMGAANTALGPDFVGALRDAMEGGDDSGPGGTALFLNGAYGGRLTVPADSAVTDPRSGAAVAGVGSAKAEALGRFVAGMADSLTGGSPDSGVEPYVQIARAGVRLAVDNERVLSGIQSGRISRSLSTDSLVATETSMLVIGDAWVLAMPGETFPELVNGGITATPGADYVGRPETPTMRPLMLGRVNMVTVNADDALGPIIPYVEWDLQPPRSDRANPGEQDEIRAVGPFTANVLQRGFISLMRTSAAVRGRNMGDGTSPGQ